MRETLRTKAMHWAFNLFPCFRGTGGRITFISGDLHYARIAVPLNWRTRNYVGTIFGGSMFGAVDPIYLVMFIETSRPGLRHLGQGGIHSIQEARTFETAGRVRH